MDIERLTATNKDGQAYLVNVKPNEQEVYSPYKNSLQCIMDCFERLAQYEEEAIAIQSVTDEAVQEAIDWVTSRKTSSVHMNGEIRVYFTRPVRMETLELIEVAFRQMAKGEG